MTIITKKINYFFYIIMILFLTTPIKNKTMSESSKNIRKFPFFIAQYMDLKSPFFDLLIPSIGYFTVFKFIEDTINKIRGIRINRGRGLARWNQGWPLWKISLTLMSLIIRPPLNPLDGFNLFNKTASTESLEKNMKEISNELQSRKDYNSYPSQNNFLED